MQIKGASGGGGTTNNGKASAIKNAAVSLKTGASKLGSKISSSVNNMFKSNSNTSSKSVSNVKKNSKQTVSITTSGYNGTYEFNSTKSEPVIEDPSKKILDVSSELKKITSSLNLNNNNGKKQSVNITTASGNMGSVSYNIDEERKKAQATGATVALGFVEGIGTFGESLSDVGKMIAMVKATPITVAIDALQVISSFSSGERVNSVTENMWNVGRNDIEQEKVKGSFDHFYQDTEIGKAISNDLSSHDLVRSVSSGIGYTASIIATGGVLGAITGATSAGGGVLGYASSNAGSMAVMAGTAGFGKNTQDAWNNGAGTAEGILAGAAGGLKEAGQFYLGGKIAGLNPTSNNALNKVIRVGLDGIDNAAEGFIDPAINLIYSKDSNYANEFNKVGGYDNVRDLFFVGIGASSLGEVSDWLGGLLKREGELSNVDINGQSEKNIARDTSHVTRKSDIDSRVPRIESDAGVKNISQDNYTLTKSGIADSSKVTSVKQTNGGSNQNYGLPNPDSSSFVREYNSHIDIDGAIKEGGSLIDRARSLFDNKFGSEQPVQSIVNLDGNSSTRINSYIDERVPKIEEMNFSDSISSNSGTKSIDNITKLNTDELQSSQVVMQGSSQRAELIRQKEARLKDIDNRISLSEKIIEDSDVSSQSYRGENYNSKLDSVKKEKVSLEKQRENIRAELETLRNGGQLSGHRLDDVSKINLDDSLPGFDEGSNLVRSIEDYRRPYKFSDERGSEIVILDRNKIPNPGELPEVQELLTRARNAGIDVTGYPQTVQQYDEFKFIVEQVENGKSRKSVHSFADPDKYPATGVSYEEAVAEAKEMLSRETSKKTSSATTVNGTPDSYRKSISELFDLGEGFGYDLSSDKVGNRFVQSSLDYNHNNSLNRGEKVIEIAKLYDEHGVSYPTRLKWELGAMRKRAAQSVVDTSSLSSAKKSQMINDRIAKIDEVEVRDLYSDVSSKNSDALDRIKALDLSEPTYKSNYFNNYSDARFLLDEASGLSEHVDLSTYFGNNSATGSGIFDRGPIALQVITPRQSVGAVSQGLSDHGSMYGKIVNYIYDNDSVIDADGAFKQAAVKDRNFDYATDETNSVILRMFNTNGHSHVIEYLPKKINQYQNQQLNDFYSQIASINQKLSPEQQILYSSYRGEEIPIDSRFVADRINHVDIADTNSPIYEVNYGDRIADLGSHLTS